MVSCAAGESHTYFVSSEGELWSWLGEEVRRPRRHGPVVDLPPLSMYRHENGTAAPVVVVGLET